MPHRVGYPDIKCSRKGPRGKTSHYYKNLSRKKDLSSLSYVCSALSMAPDAEREQKIRTEILQQCERKDPGMGEGKEVKRLFPDFVSYFRNLPQDIWWKGMEFAILYQGFWEKIVSVVLTFDTQEMEITFKAFWGSLLSFSTISFHAQFRVACAMVEKAVYGHISDLLMSNPRKLETDVLVWRMRELAKSMPSFLSSFGDQSGMGELFVIERLGQMTEFCDVLLRRADFVENLELDLAKTNMNY